VIEIVETYLSELGEEFATAVAAQHALPVKEDRIQSIAIQLLKINTKIQCLSG
jgi:hypothetical protein